MTSQQLATVAGILISLIAFYIPWYNKQSSKAKALMMLGAMVVVAGASFGLACLNWFSIAITCDKAGAVGLIQALVVAVVANQSTYLVWRRVAG